MCLFKFDLMSVSALAEKISLYLSFFSHTCVIQDVRHSRMIGKGRLLEVLYEIDASTFMSCDQTVDRACNSTATIAHVVSRHT